MASFFSWGPAGAEAVLVAVWEMMVLGSNVSSLSSHLDANQNIKLNKNEKYPKVMHEVSVMCTWHLCSDK